MSNDDWQPGDLALCVNTRITLHDSGRRFDCMGRIRKGAVYKVERIVFNAIVQDFDLLLAEARSVGLTGGFAAFRFRKIRPHTPDAEDAETLRLLTGKPAQVQA